MHYYKHTTQVPNFILDTYLPLLTPAELKVLLVVIRQTIGWINNRTGQRKKRDWISSYQFQKKTGLSPRIITKAIRSLEGKNLLRITDPQGTELSAPLRKGRRYLYYSILKPTHIWTPTSAQNVPEPTHSSADNKTNPSKLTAAKLSTPRNGHIGNYLRQQVTLFQDS